MQYFILIFLIIFLGLVCFWGIYMLLMLIKTGVPFIPTSEKIADKMLEFVKFRENLNIYELGCGNGKLLFKIKKKCDNLRFKNISIIGYELILPLVWWIKFKNKFLPKTTNKISVFSRDFYKQDLSQADVIFCYLFPPLMQRIFYEIWPKLKKGTILISHAFKIEGLNPYEIRKTAKTTIYVYKKSREI